MAERYEPGTTLWTEPPPRACAHEPAAVSTLAVAGLGTESARHDQVVQGKAATNQTGYPRGAKAVAQTYELFVLDVCEP